MPSSSTVATPQTVNDASQIEMKKVFRVNNNVNFINSGQTLPSDPKDQYYLVLICRDVSNAAPSYDFQGSWFSRLSFIDI